MTASLLRSCSTRRWWSITVLCLLFPMAWHGDAPGLPLLAQTITWDPDMPTLEWISAFAFEWKMKADDRSIVGSSWKRLIRSDHDYHFPVFGWIQSQARAWGRKQRAVPVKASDRWREVERCLFKMSWRI